MDKETNSLLLYIGGAAAAYFLVVQPLLQKLGLQATPEEKKQAETNPKKRTENSLENRNFKKWKTL